MELNSNGIHFTLIYLSRHRTQIVRGFFSSYPTLITKQFCQKRKKSTDMFSFYVFSHFDPQYSIKFLVLVENMELVSSNSIRSRSFLGW